MSKPRILMVNEFSGLATGYSVYGMELLKRLHATGKYEIAELACYITHDDPRIEQIPWKVYPNYPESGDETEVEAYHSKPTNQFGEYSFERVSLDFRQVVTIDVRDTFMFDFEEKSPFRPYFKWCFVAETPIMLASGRSKNIENVHPGDIIVNGNGQPARVYKASQRTVTNGLISIRCASWNVPIICTLDHRWFVIKNKGRQWKSQTRRYSTNEAYYTSKQCKEVEAKDIEVGDMVICPIINTISISEPPIQYSEELAILVGYFLTEGTRDKYGHIRFCLHINEKDYALEVRKALSILFPNNNIKEREMHQVNTRTIGINSTEIANKIFSSFYNDGGFKVMPEWVFHCPDDFAKTVIRCMWRGDGCVVKNIHGYYGMEYFTNSRELALCLWQMLLRLNIVTNVVMRNHHGYTGYRFFVYGDDADRLNSIMQKRPNIQFKIGNIPKKRAWIDSSNRLVAKVTKIEHLEKETEVYDIEVENNQEFDHGCISNHSFCVPFSVHNCIMPTVDAIPQHEQWIATFMNADAVFTYTDWAHDVLKKEGGGLIKTYGSAPPGADLDTFYPMDKKEIRRQFHFEDDVNIIGTVMRLQARKLFPDLIEAFTMFQQQAPPELAKKTYLYMHTSYPDMGWDLPRLIKKYGMSHKILFTYRCRKCQAVFASFFMDAVGPCPKCGKIEAHLPNTQEGIERSSLAKIYNLFDCYVQYANSGGFEMPLVEASACGIPVMATDYSAMSDVVRKLHGYPIKVAYYRLDNEFGCYRATPSNQDLVEKWIKFFSLPESERKRKSQQSRQEVIRHYTWEQTANKWMNVIDYLTMGESALNLQENKKNNFSHGSKITVNRSRNWDSPPYIHTPLPLPPNWKEMTNEELVRWSIINILGEPEMVNSYLALRLIRDLNWGLTSRGLMGGNYFNEQSFIMTRGSLQPFGVDDMVRELSMMCEHRNKWESIRENREN